MRKQVPGNGRISSGKIKRLTLISIVVVVFALGAMAAVSLRSSSAKTAKPRGNNAETSDQHANVRYRAGAPVPFDSQTGQVRPLTQQEAQNLAAEIKRLVSQSTDGLHTEHHADGSVSLDLQGRFQSLAVAKRDEDGKIIQSCVDNPASAAAFFGIDPALVGVKRNVNATQTKNAARKGEDR